MKVLKKRDSALIYLAENRSYSSADGKDLYKSNSPQPMPVTEYYLGENGQCKLELKQNNYHLIVPIIGGIELSRHFKSNYLVAGQALLVYITLDQSIFMKNPFSNSSIHFLHFEIKGPERTEKAEQLFEFQTFQLRREDQMATKMVRIFEAATGLPFNFSAVKMKGREELNYPIMEDNSQQFIYVVNGAFECQGRLLHTKDALLFANSDSIEIEALSEEALVFVLEWICWS